MSPTPTLVQCQLKPIVLSPVLVRLPSPSTVFSVYASASLLHLPSLGLMLVNGELVVIPHRVIYGAGKFRHTCALEHLSIFWNSSLQSSQSNSPSERTNIQQNLHTFFPLPTVVALLVGFTIQTSTLLHIQVMTRSRGTLQGYFSEKKHPSLENT